jgi:uncharacterized protein YacL
MIRTALAWLMENLYNYMIPVCLLCVLRVVMCLIELSHMKRLREKKFVFRAQYKHYAEIGTFIGLFIGSVLVCVLPLKLLWAAVAVVLGIIGFKIGKKKGLEKDEFWKEVIAEMAASEDAEKLETAPQIDRSVAGLLDDLDLYGEDAPAEEKNED